MIKNFLNDLRLIRDTFLSYASRNDGIPNTLYKVKKFLEDKNIKPHHYHIHDNLSVDIKNNLFLNDENLTIIPLKFNQINGNVELSNNQLKSLKNCPRKIEGSLYLQNNPLTNLDNLPDYIKEDIHINKISEKEFKKIEKIKYFKSIFIYFPLGEAPEYFKKPSYETVLDTYTLHDKEVLHVTFNEFNSYIEMNRLDSVMTQEVKKTTKKAKI